MEAHGPCSSCTAESELVVYEGERVCSRLHNVLKWVYTSNSERSKELRRYKKKD
jgi:hypothetical protein